MVGAEWSHWRDGFQCPTDTIEDLSPKLMLIFKKVGVFCKQSLVRCDDGSALRIGLIVRTEGVGGSTLFLHGYRAQHSVSVHS
jgi:hypothetical protein